MKTQQYHGPLETLPARDCRILERAEGYLALDLPEAAVKELFGASSAANSSFAWNLLAGEALRNSGRFEQAVRYLERAHELQPDALAVLLSLGWCFKRSDRIDRAIASLREAEKLCPKSDGKTLPLVHYNLGCYLALAGRKQDAIETLSRAFERDASYLDLATIEEDLAGLRGDRDFQELVDRLKNRKRRDRKQAAARRPHDDPESPD